MSENAARPNIEIKRKLGPGYYRSYANVYFRPLRIAFYAPWKGHFVWICGGPK